MKPNPHRLTVAVVAALSLAGGAFSYAGRGVAQTPPTAATYEVRLHRPAVVGRRARVTSEGVNVRTTHTALTGQPARDEGDNVRVHFRAVERVVSVAADGRARQSDYTIERFESQDAHGAHVLARSGQVLSVTRGARREDGVFTLDGLPLMPTTRTALAMVVSLTNGAPNDDEAFGTTERRAVGASWPMNAALAQRDFQTRFGARITLSGNTQIARQAVVRRTPCLEMVATVDGTVGELPGLPQGATIRTGTLHMTMTGMFPVETSAPALTSSEDMTMQVAVELPARAGQVQITTRETKTETFEPLAR